jgi:hypothetical protein
VVALRYSLRIAGLCLLVLAGPVLAESASGCRNYNALNNLYWGDLHVHTYYSLDASTQDTRTTPAQAYAFARGAVLGVQPWQGDRPLRQLQLERPLDFAAVTDHAELLGEVALCTDPEGYAYNSLYCRGFRGFPRASFFLFNLTASLGNRLGLCGDDGERCLEAAAGPWNDIRAAAAAAYDAGAACDFTSFVAYEWTGASENRANLHRNVIFRNEAVPDLPPSFVDSEASVDTLFRQLDEQCIDAGNGCDVLSIPHNSNLSAGFMFPRGSGALDAEAARRRQRFEPLVEVFQHKGASECFFSAGVTEDELCAFEQLSYDNIAGKFSAWYRDPTTAETGFARAVLRDGLDFDSELGVNPYELGFIGSTDTHLGAPGAVGEDSFAGHGGAGAPAGEGVPPGLVDDLEYNPGGLVAVWAPENRRDALFDALRRRETYATSGPRITLRLFAGDDIDPTLCESPNFAEEGYRQGEPMGSVLRASERVRIAVAATADAGTLRSPGLPLQRLQIIKGWIDADGQQQEQVFDIAGNPENGAGVELSSCRAHGEGFAQLCTVWQDPGFSPTQRAYYYARAVENPRCRWSQQICVANGVNCDDRSTLGDGLEECCSAEHRPVIQERAVSSPVWHYPGS